MNNEKLKEFKKLLIEKNRVLNLISKNDEKFIDEKHIFDSLAIKLFFEKYGNNCNTLLDIGTGGGFPAIPIAINYPDLNVFAIDSIRKKINAVDELSKQLKLNNLNVICDRVENIKNKKFDIITSRAVAKLETICKYATPLLKKDGYIIVYKSKNVNEEINEAKKIMNEKQLKITDIIPYNLPMDEIFERNLVIITK